jgi:O-antigen/teichoic acid export membrane protein
MAGDILHGPDVGPSVVRGTIWRVGAYAVGVLLTAAASILLLRYLGVDDFGRYATVMAIVAIVGGVSDAGLTIVGTRELARRPAGAGRMELLGHLVGMRMVLTPIGVALGVGFAALAGYERELVIGTALAGVGLVLVSTQATLVGLLPVELRNLRLAVADTVRNLITTVVIAVLVVAGASLVAFFAGQIVVGMFLLAVTPLIVRREWLSGPRFAPTVWKSMLGQALAVAIAYALGLIYFRVLLIMLSLVSVDREVGLFGTSLRIYELLVGIPVIVLGVALPVLSAAATRPERFRYQLQRVSEGTLLLATFTAVGTGLAAEPIVTLLGGEEYGDAARVLQIHIAGFVPMFLASVCATTLVATDRPRALVMLNGLALGFLLLIGALLVPPYDAIGAAIAAAISETFLALISVVALAQRGHRVAPPATWLARLAVAAALGVGTGVLVPLPELAAAVLGTLIFASMVLGLRLAPPELADSIAPRRSMSG